VPSWSWTRSWQARPQEEVQNEAADDCGNSVDCLFRICGSGDHKRIWQGPTTITRQNDEHQKSIESKVSDTSSHGSESTTGYSSKKSGSIGGNSGLDLSIPAMALVPDEIEYLLPADFGLAAQPESGWVNIYEQNWLEQQAKSGA